MYNIEKYENNYCSIGLHLKHFLKYLKQICIQCVYDIYFYQWPLCIVVQVQRQELNLKVKSEVSMHLWGFSALQYTNFQFALGHHSNLMLLSKKSDYTQHEIRLALIFQNALMLAAWTDRIKQLYVRESNANPNPRVAKDFEMVFSSSALSQVF